MFNYISVILKDLFSAFNQGITLLVLFLTFNIGSQILILLIFILVLLSFIYTALLLAENDRGLLRWENEFTFVSLRPLYIFLKRVLPFLNYEFTVYRKWTRLFSRVFLLVIFFLRWSSAWIGDRSDSSCVWRFNIAMLISLATAITAHGVSVL